MKKIMIVGVLLVILLLSGCGGPSEQPDINNNTYYKKNDCGNRTIIKGETYDIISEGYPGKNGSCYVNITITSSGSVKETYFKK